MTGGNPRRGPRQRCDAGSQSQAQYENPPPETGSGSFVSMDIRRKGLSPSEPLPRPQPRKRWRRPWGCCPCPGSPSFPHQIRLAAALCLRRKAFSCSEPNFSQIRKHVSHSNRMCFLNWLHLIISPVHETSPFDFIEHPSSSFCISSHLPARSKSQKFSF